MVKKPRAYKRHLRKEQIEKQLRIWYENGYANEATSYKLAKALDMRPAATFSDILNEMVDEGILKRDYREVSGRIPTFFYSLAVSPLITEKYGKRRIVVKHKGAIAGQLELAL